MDKNAVTSIEHHINNDGFSGTVLVKDDREVLLQSAAGLANRAEKRLNKVNTRFGIASGCKLFTAIAIAQLVENNLLSFQTRLKDCLDIEFPYVDDRVTIHHLLSHSSGMADYFDEEVMDDFEDLWKQTPMYLLKNLKDFLPMFQHGEMMFDPGEKFHYNNAGYIVLGLIVEQQTGVSFQEYVESHIFKRCGMDQSGYFSLDSLPENTAYGYIDQQDGAWKTNMYSIPIKGGADGGAFVSAPDMIKLWEALVDYQLLDEQTTNTLLTPYAHVNEEVDYGYGVWINYKDNSIYKYHVMGYDPGVSFHAAFYPQSELKFAILSNKSSGARGVMKELEKIFDM
ncbi:serine hydrolase domain-containing protein [Halobacillus naozhouensis]|uniref:Serine hydrolase n=1 Tax=Halobacillus naozhouensis TaxID=554880 RepID=A0ABY8IYZ3_9BACI|nr:serine hydrolase [Halobacillus naozhouensis]WFT74423.1 serine hydrolase [Halobacillus naozhouensis]